MKRETTKSTYGFDLTPQWRVKSDLAHREDIRESK